MTEALTKKFKRQIESITLVPSDKGRFEFSIDGKLLFSKLEQGRFPDNSEIEKIVQQQLAAKK